MPGNFMAYYMMAGITIMIGMAAAFILAAESTPEGAKIPAKRMIWGYAGAVAFLAWIGVGAYMEITQGMVAKSEPAGEMQAMTVDSSALGAKTTQIETQRGRYYTVTGAFPGQKGAPLTIEHRQNGADFLCIQGVATEQPCRQLAN